ncbi:ATP-binding protein [Streptomyces sp. NPDC051776]|uniref:AlbA family DNA-binding domain-containing protein n=1 Tax=Streptomyces sp. NPDC051776 TaxID=3155414 RepID=UPI003436DABB
MHEHLGNPAGPVTFAMVQAAVDSGLEETDDLDWKEHLPQPPREGRWNEFAKDVAAMANARGGLLIFGVSDDQCLVGIDPADVNEQQLAQWVRNHVQPYLADLHMEVLQSEDGQTSVLVVDVPASQTAPHLVYGTAQRDKEQHAAVAPFRDGSHTGWMPEHQLARAYQERFARQQRAGEELNEILAFAADIVLAQFAGPEAWLVIAARPQRPLPRTVPAPTHDDAVRVLRGALNLSITLRGSSTVSPEVLRALESSADNPRTGLRRWVVSNALSVADRRSARPVMVELHHDGTLVLAANLSWKWQGQERDIEVPLPVHTDVVEQAVLDAVTLTECLGRAVRRDGGVDLTATVVTQRDTRHPFTPLGPDAYGDIEAPTYARQPHKLQLATAELPARTDDDILRQAARELAAGVLNQFGLNPTRLA